MANGRDAPWRKPLPDDASPQDASPQDTAPQDAAQMDDLPPVARALDALGVPHTVFRHTAPVHSLEEAAAARDQTPGQVVRSILFRLGEGEYAMVLVAGPAQVSWPELRKHFARSRLTMASPEEVLAVTGYAVGAVGPLGLRTPTAVLIDKSVLEQEEVSMGSGERGVAVILRTQDLVRVLGADTVEITQPPDRAGEPPRPPAG